MKIFQATLKFETSGKGLLEVTSRIAEEVRKSGLSVGNVTVFCQHTSCSLVIMENADPTARSDLENWMERLVPENDPHFEHTHEGPDDMPSHIKMALTRSSEIVPFADGKMLLGTWQGIFLWEHRARPHTRNLIVSIQGK